MDVPYPSVVFPEIPQFSLSVPEEWVAVTGGADAVWAMRAPTTNGFASNVRVAVRRVAADADIRAVVAPLQHDDDAAVDLRDTDGPLGTVAIIRRVLRLDAESAEVRQALVLALAPVAPGATTRCLFEVTGSAAADGRDTVDAVMASFRLVRPAT